MIFSYFTKSLLRILNWENKRKISSITSRSIKLGNYSIVNISDSAAVILGNNLDFRNYINILVGKNAKLNLGDGFFMNNYCSINCLDSIEIGENVLFGEGVKVYDHNHEYKLTNEVLKVERKKFTTAPVRIGENCWLGSNVTVLKGVTIGANSIIGTGCIVHKDVPANSVIVNKQEIKTTSKT